MVGGRGDRGPLLKLGDRVALFGSSVHVGGGELRRLGAAMRVGSFAAVYVLARWVGHSESTAIRSLSRACGIRCVTWPGGLSSLASELSP